MKGWDFLPTGIDIVDAWSRKIFLWTFDHSVISGILMVAPIVFWVICGLMYIIKTSVDREDTWQESLKVISTYILVPIIYLYVSGYIGYLVFK